MHATVPTYQTICSHWCNNGMMITRVVTYFLITVEAKFTGGSYCYRPGAKSMAREIIDPGDEPIALVLLNRHVVELTTKYLWLDL